MSLSAGWGLSEPELTWGRKVLTLNWGLLLILSAIAGVGAVMLYAVAQGSMDPWASRHLVRYAGGVAILIVVALTDIRLWLRYAYLLYFVALGLLIAVELFGRVGMGAQRWIDLGFMQLQPSEIMKITLVLALARYFHGLNHEEVGNPLLLLPPILILALPVTLVLRQPDLGTSLLLILSAGAMFFLAGVRWWKFLTIVVGALAALPVAWAQLAPYQQRRVMTFLDPEADPLGSGYHILQSKIALGSGGLMGKGFLSGTQSHLNFLPEKRTDFILPMLAEEFGFVGAMGLLSLYLIVLIYGVVIALRSRHQFGRLVAMGVTFSFFLYVFINTGMVTGLLPVVGVPLPLVSYGGSAMLTVMIGAGLLMSVHIHRDVPLPRKFANEF